MRLLRPFVISILLGTILGVFSALEYEKLSNLAEVPQEIETQVKNQFSPPVPENWEAIKAIKELKIIEPPIEEKEESTVKETKLTQEPTLSAKSDPPIPANPRELNITPVTHHNKELTNYNIMFFGIEDNKLQMLTVYSINKDNNWKSGTVFIPTNTLVPGTEDQSIEDYFYKNGPEKIRELVENAMEIHISYFVKVDRNLLLEVEPYLEPIYIDGEKVNIAQLFTKEITPEDEKILASLLKSLTQPSVYFGILPKLILTCKQYITTDFEMNWTNLWMHFQIAKNIDTTSVTKKIISGKFIIQDNKKYWAPSQDGWWNMVYEVTK